MHGKLAAFRLGSAAGHIFIGGESDLQREVFTDISLDYIDDKEALDSIRQSGDFQAEIQKISKVHDSIELEWQR
ncbi:MAG: hypothetical protein IJM63_01785 [Solobacterium sp.]|nr:hypothetical protein [Solobacterium sp.]